MPIRCPSASIDRADGIIAVVRDNRGMEFLDKPIPIGLIERRYIKGLQAHELMRLTAQCHEQACGNWEGRCKVPDILDKLRIAEHTVTTDKPKCSIRNDCRWYFERGAEVCQSCKMALRRAVITTAT